MEKIVQELNKKIENLNLDQLEKVLHAFTHKVISLENEMETMKNKSQTAKEVNNEKPLTEETSFKVKYFKYSSSTPKKIPSKTFLSVKSEIINVRRKINSQETHGY